MMFGSAADLYWVEVGQHLQGGNDEGCLWSLDWLKLHLSGACRLRDIDDKVVAALVATRRGEASLSGQNRKRKRAGGKLRLVAPATVNRTVIEPLRQILNRARLIWKQPVAEIAWKRHVLKEPRERVRELKAGEEARLFEALRPDYRPVVRFALTTGLRLGEIVRLRWVDVDWGGRQLTVHGKGGKVATIPLPPDVRELLWPLRGDHEEHVFTYEAARTRDGRSRGDRHPMTKTGLRTAVRRAVSAAGIRDFRFHDHRHTAATRVLRATGNLRIVQRLLRHEQITTTVKYAHVLDEDILAGMQAAADRAREAQDAIAAAVPTEIPTGGAVVSKSVRS